MRQGHALIGQTKAQSHFTRQVLGDLLCQFGLLLAKPVELFDWQVGKNAIAVCAQGGRTRFVVNQADFANPAALAESHQAFGECVGLMPGTQLAAHQ